MTDREKLEAVAKGFTDLMALKDKQAATMAEMIRACVQTLRRGPDHGMTQYQGVSERLAIRKKNKHNIELAWQGLEDLAVMLDKQSARSSGNNQSRG